MTGLLAVGVLAFLAALGTLWLLLRHFGHFALDHPNERSLHRDPVPRFGGVAIVLGLALALLAGAMQLWLIVALALFLATISFVDDLRRVNTALRLATHLGAAGFLAWYVLSPMDLVPLVVVALGVAWLTNLYNFMDGADGLAGGMACIGFGAYAAAGWIAGHSAIAVLSCAVAAAAAAFLVYNFHPARIFLGDVGSIPLGFLAGGIGVLGWRDDLWPLWFPILVFAPFIGDATLTLLRRSIRGERVWQAHREHYYQRMIRMGLGHRATALLAYLVMALCAAAAIYARAEDSATQALTLALSLCMLTLATVWVDVRWARAQRDRKLPA